MSDPLIQGLFEQLPAKGSAWPEKDRTKLLALAKAIFEMGYEPEPKALPKASQQPSGRSQTDAQGSGTQP